MEPIDLLLTFQISKLLHESIERCKLIRLYIIKKGEQLLCIILDGCTGQKHDFSARMLLQENESLCALILKSMGFVHDDVLKWHIYQNFF